ncbi:MAG: 1-acyl-sn-glycerol-3-phosphate acyltransferase [Clostridia bacterium]|nr:1-acyl-sn-glycerol-3-phosphate acyltransferase [Clostridia bacterium]
MKQRDKKAKKLDKLFKHLRFLVKAIHGLFPYKMHGNLTKHNEGSLILIGNHYSMLDVFFPVLITDRPVRFIAKAELWKGGLMKKFVQTCGCIPAKRDGTDVQTVKDAMRILKDGGVINIFPEGMRNKSYSEFLPFHGGAAALSIKTQTPIVPFVSITKIKPFKKTHVVYGDPIEFRQYYGKKITKEQLEECDEILREAMWNMRLAFMERNKIKIKSDRM